MIDFDLVLIVALTIWIIIFAIRLDSLREDVDSLREQTNLQHRISERNIKELKDEQDS